MFLDEFTGNLKKIIERMHFGSQKMVSILVKNAYHIFF